MHFEIPANDPAKLSKFYSDVFGWKFDKTQIADMDYWISPRARGGRASLEGCTRGPARRTFRGTTSAVDNIDKHIEAFKNAGGREVVGKAEIPTIGWSYIGADPEGNLIALFRGMPPAPRTKVKRKK